MLSSRKQITRRLLKAVPRGNWQLRAATFKALDTFTRRHNGPQTADIEKMLQVVGAPSLDAFTTTIVPENIQLGRPLWSDPAKSESEILDELRGLSEENKLMKNFIGQGYYGTKVPPVIVRNLLESPGWYTSYTPYQAEISQGRLESLLNYQTMITDLCALPVANASLLDEATAVGETIGIAVSNSKHKKMKFFLDKRAHIQTQEVCKTRAAGLGVELIIGDYESLDASDPNLCGVAVQYPDTEGNLISYEQLFATAKKAGAITICITDLMALLSVKAPGEIGADVAVGSAQRFGVPLGYGGPHAAFLACIDSVKRLIPGRIIGVSVDADGSRALRMALQTREQHIKREKATSNICTAQALLANMAAMYAVYHGPEGLKEISQDIHAKTKVLALGMKELGHKVQTEQFFDTIAVELSGMTADAYMAKCVEHGINVRKLGENRVAISMDETATEDDLVKLMVCAGGELSIADLHKITSGQDILGSFKRESGYLTHPVFNSYHCEMEMQRYIFRLQRKDLALDQAMIPLGSCTMKLNAAAEMLPITYPGFGGIHPFAPEEQAVGYRKLITLLEERLCHITGFDGISMQPNSGASGEYAGLRCIKAYHEANGDHHRDVCLIPVSAHGTNPASAAMSQMKLVIIKCDAKGNIDMDDLKAKAELHSANLSALMVTYPSTHGVFESTVKEICEIVHSHGGQVYLDGANMNAQTGLCRPGDIGADVCHLNLHKTFAIPHGGGGPGMGPIGLKKHLLPFAANHPVVKVGGNQSFGTVAAAPWGSASILPISYAYIEMLGAQGLKEATQVAILAANYLKKRLEGDFKILYTDANGYCAHEFILDIRPLEKSTGVGAEDIAKRLMDYGFHAPTLSFPVTGTLMVEPTESESMYEIERFADAMLGIRAEIREIEEGKADQANNVLKNAPHTLTMLTDEQWNLPYSKEKAVFPTKHTREHKYWPTVRRINNVYGDRNFVCTCPPTSDLLEE